MKPALDTGQAVVGAVAVHRRPQPQRAWDRLDGPLEPGVVGRQQSFGFVGRRDVLVELPVAVLELGTAVASANPVRHLRSRGQILRGVGSR